MHNDICQCNSGYMDVQLNNNYYADFNRKISQIKAFEN
jgi:hypothetical protein